MVDYSCTEYINFLTLEECSYLIDGLDSDSFILSEKENRLLFIYKINTPKWLNDKLNKIGIYNNMPVSVNKYETGCFFSKHRDRYELHEERYRTLLIKLSNNYEGGNLYIDDTEYLKNIGDAVVFDSDLIHELTKISSGVRYSLVCWLTEDSFNKNKSII